MCALHAACTLIATWDTFLHGRTIIGIVRSSAHRLGVLWIVSPSLACPIAWAGLFTLCWQCCSADVSPCILSCSFLFRICCNVRVLNPNRFENCRSCILSDATALLPSSKYRASNIKKWIRSTFVLQVSSAQRPPTQRFSDACPPPLSHQTSPPPLCLHTYPHFIIAQSPRTEGMGNIVA